MKIGALTIAADDISFLANEWEHLTSKIEYSRFEFAMYCLTSVCDSYLRGRSIKLNNSFPSVSIEHLFVRSTLMLTVSKRVSNDKSKVIWFPTLCRLGFDDGDKSREKLEELLKQYGYQVGGYAED